MQKTRYRLYTCWFVEWVEKKVFRLFKQNLERKRENWAEAIKARGGSDWLLFELAEISLRLSCWRLSDVHIVWRIKGLNMLIPSFRRFGTLNIVSDEFIRIYMAIFAHTSNKLCTLTISIVCTISLWCVILCTNIVQSTNRVPFFSFFVFNWVWERRLFYVCGVYNTVINLFWCIFRHWILVMKCNLNWNRIIGRLLKIEIKSRLG